MVCEVDNGPKPKPEVFHARSEFADEEVRRLNSSGTKDAEVIAVGGEVYEDDEGRSHYVRRGESVVVVRDK